MGEPEVQQDEVARAGDLDDLLGRDFIKTVKNTSDSIMNRVRIYFKNGRELSLVQGPYSFGGPDGLFEIMLIGKDGDPDLFDKEDQGDSVCGYLSKERVEYYISKIGMMP